MPAQSLSERIAWSLRHSQHYGLAPTSEVLADWLKMARRLESQAREIEVVASAIISAESAFLVTPDGEVVVEILDLWCCCGQQMALCQLDGGRNAFRLDALTVVHPEVA